MDDNQLIKGHLEPGSTIELQFKLSHNRDVEYVCYDKQMAMDMMFVVYSLTKKEDLEENDVADMVGGEMEQMGSKNY